MTKFRGSGATAFSDWMGIAASTACALHCLLLPALLVAGSSVPVAFLADESVHKVLLLFVIPAAVVAFGIGCLEHKDKWVLALGAFGISGMLFAVIFAHDLVGESGERVITLICAAALITAHVRNYRLCRSQSFGAETPV
ncbi:MAG: MerC domain-containing protein [Pseudomonadota bacterium]